MLPVYSIVRSTHIYSLAAVYPLLASGRPLGSTGTGKRNLGRDDRIPSYWGKEVRYSYLDKDFVRYTLGLKVWQKCDFREGLSEEVAEDVGPAKMLSRLLTLGLGLQGAAREKGGAIQFGARTAKKVEIGNGRKKGTDVAE